MPTNKSKATRDELLIENALLKYHERVREMLKQELGPIYKSFDLQNIKIEHLDKRVGNVETDLNNIKEVVEPFSKFRKQMWIFFVGATLIASFMSQGVQDIIKKWFNV